MVRPIFAIRPEPGLSRTIAAGREAGLAIAGAPLFEVRPVAWDPPPTAGIDALLLGSANALRHGGPALAGLRSLPVHAVGQSTAQAAREAGFTVAQTGEGGLQRLLDQAGGASQHYLRLAGRAHVPLTPVIGSSITTCVVYESAPLPMPSTIVDKVENGTLVLLHSAEAARHFADECDRLDIPRSRIALAAMGPRVAAAAGTGWAELRSAENPDERALLALARDMCH